MGELAQSLNNKHTDTREAIFYNKHANIPTDVHLASTATQTDGISMIDYMEK